MQLEFHTHLIFSALPGHEFVFAMYYSLAGYFYCSKSAGEDTGIVLALKGVIGECYLILYWVTRRNLPLSSPHATISFPLCLIHIYPADPLQSKGFGLRTQEPNSEGEPHPVSAALRPEEVCPVRAPGAGIHPHWGWGPQLPSSDRENQG